MRHRRHRRNPALVIYNPPDMKVRRVSGGRIVGIIAQEVHDIRYRHAEDGKDYEHKFDPGVKMFAIRQPDGTQEVRIVGDRGQPLWEDF